MFQSTVENWNRHAALFFQAERDQSRRRLERGVSGTLWSKCDDEAKRPDKGKQTIRMMHDPILVMGPESAYRETLLLRYSVHN